MNILIIESKPLIQIYLRCAIKNNFEHWYIDTAYTYEEAIILSIRNKYDFFIIDYEFEKNNKNIISIGNYISSMDKYTLSPIVFGISNNDYIIDMINQLNCLYLLIKPYNNKQFLLMLKKILKYIPSKTTISFVDKYGINAYINLEDIIYIKSDRHTLNVVMYDSNLTCTNYSLSSLSESYSGLLVRCHKSYLINPQYITFIDKINCCLTLKHTSSCKSYTIAVGRKYINSILNSNFYNI